MQTCFLFWIYVFSPLKKKFNRLTYFIMRLDIELVNRNLYPTRAKAVSAIKSGLVSVNGIIAQ
ncbi:MAG: hypothetical protein JXL97_00400, partial [Bacteroidales bacterium]|nr:hypothetical protein [Bacteroidales bacterium]